MLVTIWRHGEAGAARSDRDRALTTRGANDIKHGCHQFQAACEAKNFGRPQAILHSPYTRTVETANILASNFKGASIKPLRVLEPGNDVAGVEAALDEQLLQGKAADHIILVSHQPLVSYLLNYLLGEAGRVPSLSPGALATVELDTTGQGCACLAFWAMAPKYEVGH